MAILVRVGIGIDFNTVDQLCDFLDVQVKQNDWELLEDAKQATMHGIVIKLHESQTYDRATLLNLKQKDVKVICGLVLNHFSGGLNPFTVDAVIQSVAQIIWMPTFSSKQHQNYFEERKKSF